MKFAAEKPNTDIDQILLAVTVMIIATIVAGSVAKQLNLGSIVALLVVGMALGPHSPRPLLTGHVEELQTVGEIGVILLLFLVGLETKPGRLSSTHRLFLGLGTAQYLLTGLDHGIGHLASMGSHQRLKRVSDLVILRHDDYR